MDDHVRTSKRINHLRTSSHLAADNSKWANGYFDIEVVDEII